MDSAPYLDIPPPAGLNLDNYFPTKCSYDSVIYVHKKFLPEYKSKYNKNHEAPETKRTLDKCQQFDSGNLNTDAYKIREAVKNSSNKDPLMEQTIRFAQAIIPLTIPPSANGLPPPEYSIKTIKKARKKSSCTHKNESAKDVTYDKEKHKHELDNLKREKLKRHRESISARETVSSSQNNTLDDINENRTLSYTLSEMSEQKHHKEDRHCKRNKRNEMQKVAVSESFEAVATEFMNTSSDTKIKIHLMNERDKNLFCENIQAPVIGALKECIVELNNEHLKVLQNMQTSIAHQTKKIEAIYQKLTSFEEKFDLYTRDKTSTTYTAASKTTKASRLEELSADILQVKGVGSSDEEELGEVDLLDRSVKESCFQVRKPIDKNDFERGNKKIENLGCGEDVPVQLRAQLGVNPDKPNRVPTRFCWTDAGRN
ncbi:uncharacterized protein [Epargyreus clarus]|uniref:uncharacterized protein n=1 Tax=Epargyreus clarus TaxID=520877 RepID=UPI003C2C918A